MNFPETAQELIRWDGATGQDSFGTYHIITGLSTSGAYRLLGLIRRITPQEPELSALSARIQNPIEFQPPRGGRTAFGYEATILADICEDVLAARKANKLQPQQEDKSLLKPYAF